MSKTRSESRPRLAPTRRNGLLGLLSFATLLFVWGLLSYTRLVDDIFLPSPSRVVATLWALFTERQFLDDVVASTLRVVIGFLLSAVLAVPLGLLMANYGSADRFFRPFLAFSRYLPVSAFIPLLILWVGIGFSQKLVIIFMGVFFHLTLLVADDASRTPRAYLDAAKTLGSHHFELGTHIRFPFALPAIIDDLRVMLGAAWTYLVVAELVAANTGIGRMMMDSQRFLRTDRVMAGILTIGLIGIITDQTLRLAGRVLTPWQRLI